MSETSLQNAYDRIENLELKLESANEQIRRLEEAGDVLAQRAAQLGLLPMAIEGWLKAKP